MANKISDKKCEEVQSCKKPYLQTLAVSLSHVGQIFLNDFAFAMKWGEFELEDNVVYLHKRLGHREH